MELYVSLCMWYCMDINGLMCEDLRRMRDRLKRLVEKNKAIYRMIYLLWLVYGKLVSTTYFLMRLCPINPNKIVFCTAKGKRYGDNSMYISDELLKRKKGYKIVWLLNKNVEEDIPDGVIRRNYNFFTVIYELCTAKIWVDTNMKDLGFLKRKGQLYIQTWHGSYGLKKVGGDLGKEWSPIDWRLYQYAAKRTDVMVSNSKRTTEIYRRAFWFEGTIIEQGSPRNDIFFKENGQLKKKVYRYFNLNDQRIALYAPTYRNNYRTDDYKLDYTKLRNALAKRFGGNWVILVRLHPNNLMDAADFIKYTDVIINASEYSVMQELLVVSDVLITDYSSCMFDFATTEKPCFIYATDVACYKTERDNYFELEDLPFSVAENNEQLENVIISFDEEQYKNRLRFLFKRVGLNETGHASEIVADYIEKWISEN